MLGLWTNPIKRNNPKKDCKVSNLYWAFLERHKDSFEGNIRMAMPLRSLAKRSDDKKRADVEAFQDINEALANGQEYLPYVEMKPLI